MKRTLHRKPWHKVFYAIINVGLGLKTQQEKRVNTNTTGAFNYLLTLEKAREHLQLAQRHYRERITNLKDEIVGTEQRFKYVMLSAQQMIVDILIGP